MTPFSFVCLAVGAQIKRRWVMTSRARIMGAFATGLVVGWIAEYGTGLPVWVEVCWGVFMLAYYGLAWAARKRTDETNAAFAARVCKEHGMETEVVTEPLHDRLCRCTLCTRKLVDALCGSPTWKGDE